MEEWLEDDDNMDVWAGNYDSDPQKKLTASKRRVLITNWVGEAHERLQHPHYHGFLWNCFERTGCLMTADGSEDFKVKPEGLLDFKVIPPLESPGPEMNPQTATPEADDTFNDMLTSRDNFDDENETETEEDLVLEQDDVDDEQDRLYNVKLVGKKVCGDYPDGWHTGTIKYYNSKLDKYLLVFEDGSDDLIREEEIDGVELFFPDMVPKRSKRVNYAALAKGN